MSRAFVKEDDADPGVVALPDRPVSPHRNLVTRRGLRLIESKVARYENDLARATAAADREALGRAARELRYWTARLASAEVAEPDPEADHVVFGMAVTVLREDETEATFRIVGEDEARSVDRQDRLDRARGAGALGQPAGGRSATADRRGRGLVHQWDARSARVALGDTTFTDKPGSLLLPIHQHRPSQPLQDQRLIHASGEGRFSRCRRQQCEPQDPAGPLRLPNSLHLIVSVERDVCHVYAFS